MSLRVLQTRGLCCHGEGVEVAVLQKGESQLQAQKARRWWPQRCGSSVGCAAIEGATEVLVLHEAQCQGSSRESGRLGVERHSKGFLETCAAEIWCKVWRMPALGQGVSLKRASCRGGQQSHWLLAEAGGEGKHQPPPRIPKSPGMGGISMHASSRPCPRA